MPVWQPLPLVSPSLGFGEYPGSQMLIARDVTHRCGRVRVQSSSMVWPVVFLYPATGHNDFIEQFAEVSTFEEHLQVRPLLCCCCYLRC